MVDSTVFQCGSQAYTVTLTSGDGTPLTVGSTVTNRSGDEITIHGVTRGPEHNGTAKVDVTIVTSATRPQHNGFRNDFYDHAMGLTVTAVAQS